MGARAGGGRIEWGRRFRHTGAELGRAMAWFDATFGSA